MDTTNSTRSKLRIPNDAMYRLLREGCITEFNVKKASGEKVDLRACDLRGLDLRGLDADGLDFSDHDVRSPALLRRRAGSRALPLLASHAWFP